jgi:hypothetical protein
MDSQRQVIDPDPARWSRRAFIAVMGALVAVSGAAALFPLFEFRFHLPEGWSDPAYWSTFLFYAIPACGSISIVRYREKFPALTRLLWLFKNWP